MKRRIGALAAMAAFLFLTVFSVPADAEELRLLTTEADVRGAVLTGNPDLRALTAMIRRDEAVVDGVDASFGPTLAGEASLARDRRQPLNSFQPAETETGRFGLSASQSFVSGVNLAAGFSIDQTHLSQSEPANAALPYPETYFLPRLFVDARIDLLRDIAGYLSERRRDKALLGVRATRHDKEAATALVATGGAVLFWNIRALDEIKATTEEFLDNLETLEDEVRVKVKRSLAEPGDLYKLKALIAMRRASLITLERRRQSLEEGIAALIGGDGAIGVLPATTLTDGERSVMVCATSIGALPPFDRTLSSSYEGYEARLAAAGIDREMLARDTLPDLALVGSYATTGTDTGADDALREATGTDRDQFYLGVRLSLPLSVEHERSKQGLGAAAVALAETAYEKRLADDRAWFNSARSRLIALDEEIVLVREAVADGRRQLDDLRRRYRQGRIPLYQMVTEEADVLQFHLRLKELAAERIALVRHFTGRFDRVSCEKGE